LVRGDLVYLRFHAHGLRGIVEQESKEFAINPYGILAMLMAKYGQNNVRPVSFGGYLVWINDKAKFIGGLDG